MRLGRREFWWRLFALSSESRFLAAYQHGKGPEPTVEDSIAVLDSTAHAGG